MALSDQTGALLIGAGLGETYAPGNPIERGFSPADVCVDCDHIPAGLEARLQAGRIYAEHSGGRFAGFLYFEDGKFHNYVMRFRMHEATYSADTLQEVVHAPICAFGCD